MDIVYVLKINNFNSGKMVVFGRRLNNGDFSDGFSFWNCWTQQVVDRDIIRTYNGENFCLSGTADRGAGWWTIGLQSYPYRFELEEGVQYKISFDASSTDNSDNIFFSIDAQDNIFESNSRWYSNSISLSSEMQTYTFTVDAPSANSRGIIQIWLGGTSGTIILDNVSIVPIAAP